MTYTMSSPTVLATDAACHPCALELLDTLSAVFRLTEGGLTELGLTALDADPAATARAWTAVELVDVTALSTIGVLRSAAAGGLPGAETVARSRLGDVRDVTRLVVTEAALWPDPARLGVVGGLLVPPSAAAAAGVVGACWTSPHLPQDDVDVLSAPWRRTRERGVPEGPAEDAYGPRGPAVVELRRLVERGAVDLEALAAVTWPAGVWVDAMHAGAAAAYSSGRLREQMVAVLDLTAAVLRPRPVAPDPVLLRSALPALHALTVATLLGDVMPARALADLHLATLAL